FLKFWRARLRQHNGSISIAQHFISRADVLRNLSFYHRLGIGRAWGSFNGTGYIFEGRRFFFVCKHERTTTLRLEIGAKVYDSWLTCRFIEASGERISEKLGVLVFYDSIVRGLPRYLARFSALINIR